MSDDSFTHDEGRFDRAAHPGSVGVSEGEARYAELFSEVIWDGVITPDKRQRLQTAAETFGLSPERAYQIEEALSAAHRLNVVEARDPTSESRDDERALEPLIDSNDPPVLVLQRRIHLLEGEHGEILRDNARLHGLNEGLEELVSQLQNALESSLGELDQVYRELSDKREEVDRTRQEAMRQEAMRQEAMRQHAMQQREPRPETAPIATPYEGAHPAPARSRAPSVPPASMPFKPSPSAPGDSEPPPAWSDERSSQGPPSTGELPPSVQAPSVQAPSVQVPDAPPTVRGFMPPEDGTLAEAPPVYSMTQKVYRSRRILAAASDSAPMAAIRARRENPAEIHKLVRQRPRDAALHHELYRSLQRADDLDRRWCIAHTLVFLGEADEDERAHYIDHLSAGLVRPTRAVNEDEWRELLFHPDEDPLTGEILACIAPAVLIGQMSQVRQSHAELLDPQQRIEPKTSTLQAVRCMEWAAAFLGLELPSLFACPDHEGITDIVLNPAPCTRLGKHALTGRSSKELAFVAGRHLTWYRKEHLIGRAGRSVRRMEDVFLAALTIGNPGLPMAADIKRRVEPIVQTIRPLLDSDTVDKLGHCFSRFVEHGGRTSLSRWYRGVERTSACTGLLLANDLHVAQSMLELESSLRAPGGDAAWLHEAVDELIVFYTAGRCSLLRRRIGLAIISNDD